MCICTAFTSGRIAAGAGEEQLRKAKQLLAPGITGESMIDGKIRISIVLTLRLDHPCPSSFHPVLLSIIFVISLLCIWIFLKRQKPFSKIELFFSRP